MNCFDCTLDLRRAGIEPFGWVVNATLTRSETEHPVLTARAELERGPLARVGSIARRVWTLPWDPGIASSA